jgi:hypothetical protein
VPAVLGVLAASATLGCAAAVDKYPLPDEFDAAFVTGKVCTPGTSRAGADYPIRFETCVYRCVEVDTSQQVQLNSFSLCSGAACQMQLLLTAHLKKVAGQADCDARDLANPPASECTPQQFNFDTMAFPKSIDNTPMAGVFLVKVPYLDYEQGNRLVSRLKKGESPDVVIQDVVGVQDYPQRQFQVVFDPLAPASTLKASELGPETCHAIAAP